MCEVPILTSEGSKFLNLNSNFNHESIFDKDDMAAIDSALKSISMFGNQSANSGESWDDLEPGSSSSLTSTSNSSVSSTLPLPISLSSSTTAALSSPATKSVDGEGRGSGSLTLSIATNGTDMKGQNIATVEVNASTPGKFKVTLEDLKKLIAKEDSPAVTVMVIADSNSSRCISTPTENPGLLSVCAKVRNLSDLPDKFDVTDSKRSGPISPKHKDDNNHIFSLAVISSPSPSLGLDPIVTTSTSTNSYLAMNKKVNDNCDLSADLKKSYLVWDEKVKNLKFKLNVEMSHGFNFNDSKRMKSLRGNMNYLLRSLFYYSFANSGKEKNGFISTIIRVTRQLLKDRLSNDNSVTNTINSSANKNKRVKVKEEIQFPYTNQSAMRTKLEKKLLWCNYKLKFNSHVVNPQQDDSHINNHNNDNNADNQISWDLDDLQYYLMEVLDICGSISDIQNRVLTMMQTYNCQYDKIDCEEKGNGKGKSDVDDDQLNLARMKSDYFNGIDVYLLENLIDQKNGELDDITEHLPTSILKEDDGNRYNKNHKNNKNNKNDNIDDIESKEEKNSKLSMVKMMQNNFVKEWSTKCSQLRKQRLSEWRLYFNITITKEVLNNKKKLRFPSPTPFSINSHLDFVNHLVRQAEKEREQSILQEIQELLSELVFLDNNLDTANLYEWKQTHVRKEISWLVETSRTYKCKQSNNSSNSSNSNRTSNIINSNDNNKGVNNRKNKCETSASKKRNHLLSTASSLESASSLSSLSSSSSLFSSSSRSSSFSTTSKNSNSHTRTNKNCDTLKSNKRHKHN